jgi:hypothetical protein
MASSDSCGPKVLKEILSCGITWKLTGKLTMGAMAFSQADNLRADNQVPGTIRYLARSGTWHDLVPGTTWQMFVVLGSLALLATPHQRGGSPKLVQKSKIRPLRKNVYTSRFLTPNPKSYNTHIYHFHISESLNLDFFKILGTGGGGGYLFNWWGV